MKIYIKSVGLHYQLIDILVKSIVYKSKINYFMHENNTLNQLGCIINLLIAS